MSSSENGDIPKTDIVCPEEIPTRAMGNKRKVRRTMIWPLADDAKLIEKAAKLGTTPSELMAHLVMEGLTPKPLDSFDLQRSLLSGSLTEEDHSEALRKTIKGNLGSSSSLTS